MNVKQFWLNIVFVIVLSTSPPTASHAGPGNMWKCKASYKICVGNTYVLKDVAQYAWCWE